MRAIIHSIHSQVPQTIDNERLDVETIVSMDSHLDVSLGGDETVYPEELRIIVARTGAHAAFRHMTGGLTTLNRTGARERDRPEVVVAISEAMLARHATDVESRLPAQLRIRDQRESIRSVVEFLAQTMGIEVYASPPKSLSALARRTKGVRAWLLDIDVDYMHEMQSECYTRIFNPGPGVLQTEANVLDFVERSKPETIAISEAKVSAIRNPRSNFSAFVRKLKALGYSIEERGVFATDAEVIKGISVCREFYRTVSTKLMARQMDAMMRSDLERFQEEEEIAAKRFFRSKGYAV